MTTAVVETVHFLTKRRLGLLVVIALLVLLFFVGALFSDRFATPSNILNVYEQSTGLAFVSLGQTLAILTGGIDLSVGSIISLPHQRIKITERAPSQPRTVPGQGQIRGRFAQQRSGRGGPGGRARSQQPGGRRERAGGAGGGEDIRVPGFPR